TFFLQACAQQCGALARARRWQECHALARRWLDAQPLSSDAALYLLNASKAPATRAALAHALDEFEALRAHLAREFRLPPEPAVRSLAEGIREQLATAAPDAPIEEVTVAVPTVPVAMQPREIEQTQPADPVPTPRRVTRARSVWNRRARHA